MTPIIKVRNLHIVYQKGTPSEIEALKGSSIEVYPEEFLIIYGPSGCGKSTLLYAISGIEEEIESGEIWYRDKNIREMSKKEFIMYHRHAIGMIFQGYQLIPTLSVLDNVTLPMVFEGVPWGERRKRGLEILEHFDLKKFAKNLPNELSGGQQQRVGIARALVNNPEIILADEPTGNLDSESAVNVMNTLSELNRTMKKTIVLVTHEGQSSKYASRIVFMKDGNVVDEVRQEVDRENIIQDNFKASEQDQKGQKDLHLHAIKAINFLGFNTSSEEYSRMEEGIRSFFERKINKDHLFEILHKPIQKGGVGLYKQKAERLADQIEEIVELSDMIKDTKHDGEKVVKVKTSYVTDWLLKAFHGHITPSQKTSLISVVSDRINGKMNHLQMQNKLDLSESEGGVGLNFHTARNISQRLEVVLGFN